MTHPHAWFGMTCTWSPITGGCSSVPDVDVAVLLVDRVEVGGRQPDDRAVAVLGSRVRRERLGAGVDHDLARNRVGDDAHLDEERALVERSVRAVEQGVRARTKLVDTGLVGQEARGSRPARDPVAAQAGRDEGVARLAEQRIHLADACADRLGVAPAVPGIAADPGDLDRGQPGQPLCERERACCGGLPGAVQAHVHLDEQRRVRSVPHERRGEPLGCVDPVDRDREIEALGSEPREALPLGVADRRVVDEHARRTGIPEHLGLAGLRHREAACAQRELEHADLGRLVRLRVRPERDRVLVRVRLEAAQVGLEAIEIDDCDRRLDLGERSADLLLEQLECPIRAGSDGVSHWTPSIGLTGRRHGRSAWRPSCRRSP